MIRATNVYGPHQQLFKIIPRSIIYMMQKKKIPLHGGGRAVKISYSRPRCVARRASCYGERQAGRHYQLSPDQGVAVKEVVWKIATS